MQHDITLLSGSIFRWEYILSKMKLFLLNGSTTLMLILLNRFIELLLPISCLILFYNINSSSWEKMIQSTRGYLGFPVIQNVLLM